MPDDNEITSERDANDQRMAEEIAKRNNLSYVNLSDFVVDKTIFQLIGGERTCREELCVPICREADLHGDKDRVPMFAARYPWDVDVQVKLEFILNRKISFVVSTRKQVLAAIDLTHCILTTVSYIGPLHYFEDSSDDFTKPKLDDEQSDAG